METQNGNEPTKNGSGRVVSVLVETRPTSKKHLKLNQERIKTGKYD